MNSTDQSAGKHRLLVLDDEENVQESLKIILEFQGYQVLTASTAKAGLHILKTSPCELVVLDLKIPDYDGFELLKLIRHEYPDTKIILITGFGTLDIARRALALGAHYYFDKPIDLEKFIENVRKALTS